MTRTTLALSLSLLTFGSACVDEADLGTTAQPVWGGDGEECPKLGCGSNSAYLGPTEFHELDETGVTPNAEGFRITSFTKNGVAYRADVTGTTLVGKQYFWGFGWITTLTGTDLVGSELAIEGLGGALFTIKIFNTSTTQGFWQGPAGLVNTYELKWRQSYPTVTHYVPVCKDPPNRIDGEGKEWNKIYEAILFTGDRYDTDALTVSVPRGINPWFNIGCAGTVLAKLALNRHTVATAVPGAPPPPPPQCQAMLKMYTSDVCNTGDAFTVQGTAIRWWSTVLGWSSPAIAVNSMEARWDENGATCLDTHRLHGSFDDMDAQIADACASVNRVVPACAPNPAPYYFRTSSPAMP